MVNNLAAWVILAWVPITLILVGMIGPRRASPIVILGAYLFLPRFAHWDFLGPLLVEKRTIPGPTLLLAALIFDHRTVLRGRPRWLDLPMAAFVLTPLIGWAWNGFDKTIATFDQAWLTLAEWAIPYAIARLYFSDADGPRRLARAIVVGGLAYVPVCWYETVAGPSYYLGRSLYGLEPYRGMVERLGGYRPEGFLGHGLELATWMALTTVASGWVWPPRWFSTFRIVWWPSWSSPLASSILAVTTLACRGVYGYAEMAMGLVATAVAVGLRSKVVVMVLFLVPPAYMAARASGIWDGGQLREIAQRAGRESTIGVRLVTEDVYLRDARAGNLAFGVGGRFPYWEADGWWLTTLKGGGLVGLAAFYGAFMIPAGLVVFGPRRRFPARSVEVGLALLLGLMMIDSLHNTSPVAAMPMIAGTLVASFLANRQATPTKTPASRASIPVALVATLILLALAEVIGQLPRNPGPDLGTHARP